jgi:uncharacterized protein YodC (DUF2158 family)
MEDLKTGDVVRLNSGGPKMTVEKVLLDDHSNRIIRCAWMDDPGAMQVQRGEFYEAEVSKIA